MKAQCLALLSAVTISTTSMCAESSDINFLLAASYQTFNSMNPTELGVAKQALKDYIRETENAFYNQELLLGITRRAICNSLVALGVLSVSGGFMHSGLEVCSPMQGFDTCPTIRQAITKLRGVGIGTVCGIILFGITNHLRKHPAQRQLDKIYAIEKRRRKEAKHAAAQANRY